MAFVKLYGTILDSSIWREPNHVRLVWITMLAMADEDGIVHASVGGLAHRAVVSREEAEDALERLLAPDPDDRSGEHEGRRIEALQGAWRILNHHRYRRKQTKRQLGDARRQARRRERIREAASIDVSSAYVYGPQSEVTPVTANHGERQKQSICTPYSSTKNTPSIVELGASSTGQGSEFFAEGTETEIPVPPPAPKPAQTDSPPKVNGKVHKRGGKYAAVLPVVERVLAALSRRTHVAYRVCDGHAKLIAARMRDGATEEDLRLVVWHRAKLWTGTEQEQFLRPSTLFRPGHWEEYLAQARAAWRKEHGDKRPKLDLAEGGAE